MKSHPPVRTAAGEASPIPSDAIHTAHADVLMGLHTRSSTSTSRSPAVIELRSRRVSCSRRRSELLLEAAFDTPRAVATTTRLFGRRALGVTAPRVTVASSTSTDGHGKALNNAVRRSMARLLPGVHAVVVGEVPANHVRLHGRPVPRQGFALVGNISTVFPVVDPDFAEVAMAVRVRFVQRFRPGTSSAETCWCESLSVI